MDLDLRTKRLTRILKKITPQECQKSSLTLQSWGEGTVPSRPSVPPAQCPLHPQCPPTPAPERGQSHTAGPTHNGVTPELGHLVQAHGRQQGLPHLELEHVAQDDVHGVARLLAVVNHRPLLVAFCGAEMKRHLLAKRGGGVPLAWTPPHTHTPSPEIWQKPPPLSQGPARLTRHLETNP